MSPSSGKVRRRFFSHFMSIFYINIYLIHLYAMNEAHLN